MKMVNFSEKQKKVIKYPFDRTLDVFEGSPRSAKTTAVAFRMARFYINSKDSNHLVIAYNQEQAFRLVLDCDGLGLIHIFGPYANLKNDRFGSHLQIHTPNGVKNIYYKGGGKAHNYKSIQGMSLGSVVFAEIDLLHMNTIQECFRRTFAAKNRYHIADLNPPSPNHPVIKEVFEIQDTRWTHWTIQDNPIITEKRKAELKETLSKNPYLYKRDWLGKRVTPQGVIYSKFDHEENQIPAIRGRPYEMYYAADAGQSDATTVTCNIVTWLEKEKKFRLNQVAMFYHSGRETGQVKAMSQYAAEIKKFINWSVRKFEMTYTNFFVDPAAKSLREELHLLGIQTARADNNSAEARKRGGGIEVGIERVQNIITNKQFMLIDTDKYDHYHFLKEVGMYCRNEAGHPIDEYNDVMDTVRYATNYFYKNYVK